MVEQQSQDVATLREQLQSDSPETRAAALARLYPRHHAILLTIRDDGECVTAGAPANDPTLVPRMFPAILRLAMDLGGALGLELNWGQKRPADQRRQIVVPHAMPTLPKGRT